MSKLVMEDHYYEEMCRLQVELARTREDLRVMTADRDSQAARATQRGANADIAKTALLKCAAIINKAREDVW